MPQRTCVVCRTTTIKRALIRIVRTPEGPVVIDHTGKRNGRGAYLCANRRCWEIALKRNTLNHALKTVISAEDRETIRAWGADLPLVADVAEPSGPAGEMNHGTSTQ